MTTNRQPAFWITLAVVLGCGLGTVIARCQPSVRLTATTERIHVEYLNGQFDYACTVYTSTSERIILDGKDVPYAPRHCQFIDKRKGSYEDDWEYIKPNGGEWDVQAILWDTDKGEQVQAISNVARVRR